MKRISLGFRTHVKETLQPFKALFEELMQTAIQLPMPFKTLSLSRQRKYRNHAKFGK